MSIEKLLTWVGNDPIRWALVIALIALGCLTLGTVFYAWVRMLLKRNVLCEEIEALTGELAKKRGTLLSKWRDFKFLLRTKSITHVPLGAVEKANRVAYVVGKLDKLVKPTPEERVQTSLFNAKQRLTDKKSEVLVKTRLEDRLVNPILWFFLYIFYGTPILANQFACLVIWSARPVILSWPSHTMRRLNCRLEYLRGLEEELDATINSVDDLIKDSKVRTLKAEIERKERAEARREAEKTAKKRQMFEEIRQELVEAVKFHLTAPLEEILRGCSLISLETIRAQWRIDFGVFEFYNPRDSELFTYILLWGETLSFFRLVSVVEGEPSLSSLQRHAERIAESEKLILAAEEAFQEALIFSAIETAISKEPDSLGKARALLSEAAGHWRSCEFRELVDLANAADVLSREAAKNCEDLRRWEDIILAFNKKRADINENEKALLAYGVELPKTADWEIAVHVLENEIPLVWAAYDWSKLNELNKQVEDAFSARAQEVNRRLAAELNKRVAKGQQLPEGAKRQMSTDTPTLDNAAQAESNGSGESPQPTPEGESSLDQGGKAGFRYSVDPKTLDLVDYYNPGTHLTTRVDRKLAEQFVAQDKIRAQEEEERKKKEKKDKKPA